MVTIAHEMIPADVEVLYHELLERLGPAERAELARLLLDDGALWADYYPVVPAAEVKTSKRHLRVKEEVAGYVQNKCSIIWRNRVD